RKGQTDIASYHHNYGTKIWINFTEGGEYSPLKVPNKKEVSAVRLDPDGKQRLYSYNLSNGESEELIADLVIAYYTWYGNSIVVSAVIEDEQLNLYTTNVEDGKSRKYDTQVGRSFHNIPNSDLVSYISKKEDQWTIRSLNPNTGETQLIADTLPQVEDMCWIINGDIFMGKESKLYKLTPNKDNDWKEVADLSSYGIKNITRITTNAISNKLLVAAEINETKVSESTSESQTPTSDVEAIVQKQLDAYNNRDIDAFMATYTQDVKLYNYPNQLTTDGQEAMRKGYKTWFDGTPDLKAIIKKRIVIGNKVIDEEQVTANGRIFNAVAIYEVENGLISKVTFIQ
ncbi:MAG: nuclear transport factor 2 family protein, partial [Bacteroidota bacterium]